MLLFVLPVDTDDAGRDFGTLLGELEAFNAELLDKPRAIALSKLDLLSPEEREETLARHLMGLPEGLMVYPISAATGEGIDPLVRGLFDQVRREREG